MKSNTKILIYAAVGVVAAVLIGLVLTSVVQQNEFESRNATVIIDRPEIGLEFSYTEGPDALSLFEPEQVEDPLAAAFILISSSEFVALRNQEEVETPPTISLFVYNKLNAYDRPASDAPDAEDLSRKDRLLRWAEENDSVTAISRAESEPQDIEVDGVTGISYTTESAFRQTMYLISYGEFLYLFVGQYNDEGDAFRQSFDEVIESIYFI